MTVVSLRRSRSANETSYMIVEEGIKSHRRTRLTMAQKLDSDLTVAFTKERELFQYLWKVVRAEALNG